MSLKYKCKYCGCGTIDKQELCFNCREKLKVIKNSGLFGGKAKKKKQQYKTRWEWIDRYEHEPGSKTQSLVDFVNESGTIHYGRYVAQIGRK